MYSSMFAWLALLAGPLVALLNVPLAGRLVLSLIDLLACLLAVAEALLLIFQLTVVLYLPLDLTKSGKSDCCVVKGSGGQQNHQIYRCLNQHSGRRTGDRIRTPYGGREGNL